VGKHVRLRGEAGDLLHELLRRAWGLRKFSCPPAEDASIKQRVLGPTPRRWGGGAACVVDWSWQLMNRAAVRDHRDELSLAQGVAVRAA